MYGNYYGVEKKQINNALTKGKHVITRVDVQGAERIRNIIKNSIQIFILPPSIEILKTRLKKRGVNSKNDMKLRLKKAQSEISKVSEFNYSIINYAKEHDMILVTRDTENGQACQENDLPVILLDNAEIFKIVLEKLKSF